MWLVCGESDETYWRAGFSFAAWSGIQIVLRLYFVAIKGLFDQFYEPQSSLYLIQLADRRHQKSEIDERFGTNLPLFTCLDECVQEHRLV